MNLQMRHQRQWATSLVLLMTVVLLSRCAEPVHTGTQLDSTDLSSTALNSPEAFSDFSAKLHPLLRNNCGGCHGANQAPTFAVADAATSQNTLLRLGLVSLNSSASSRIVTKINSGHQGFTNTLGTEVQSAIASWATLIIASNNANGGGGVLPGPEPLTATFKSISERILEPKCVSCHGATLAKDGIRYDSYQATLNTINFSAPLESKLYTEVKSGSMPIGTGSMPLSDEEVSVIAQWIQAGAPQ